MDTKVKVQFAPLESMYVFFLGEITLWSGRSRLTAEDLGDTAAKLPPEAIASLGSKRLFPPEKLKELEQVKRLMHRLCAEVGTRFLNGYAVPIKKARALADKLEALVQKGQKLAAALLANFDVIVADWQRDNPAWAHILRAGTPEKEAVERKIHFAYKAFVTSVPSDKDIAKSFEGSVAALGDSLYQEIAEEAREFVEKSLKPGRVKGKQRTAAPVRRMVDKLAGLEFLDARIAPLCRVLGKVLERIPEDGDLEGDAYMALVCCANTLGDLQAMHSIGLRAANGEDPDMLAGELLGEDLDNAAPIARIAADGTVSTTTPRTAQRASRQRPVAPSPVLAMPARAPGRVTSVLDLLADDDEPVTTVDGVKRAQPEEVSADVARPSRVPRQAVRQPIVPSVPAAPGGFVLDF